MDFPFPGIGVVFSIEGLGGGYYGYQAWRLFMKHISPRQLGSCILVEGDTAATLRRMADEFCIGIYGSMLDCALVRKVFEPLDDPGFAPFHRRFIEKLALDEQPLPLKGRVDLGRLVTDQWTRGDHDLCLEAGWGYAPMQVPEDLDPSFLAQLKSLQQPRF
jgi:hypothetical protein